MPVLNMYEVDEKLVAADVTLFFAFCFSRALSNVLTSPDFPGWLAPIEADPVRLETTLFFAGQWHGITASNLHADHGSSSDVARRIALDQGARLVCVRSDLQYVRSRR